MNQRTRQLMVHPHIEKLALVDLYLSPIEFDPGRPPGEDVTLALRKGETARVGEAELVFVGFDLQADGNALAQMESGGPVTVGAALDVRQNGSSQRVLPLYRFQPDGQVESPAAPLAGGGTVFLTGINATDGSIQLVARGLTAASAGGIPPRLSLDVTKKPLINLVWYGLYVVLAGGGLAAVHRFRQARLLDRVDAEDS
jgi:cytochrome c-type biogenesis protein CcmF